VVETVGLRNFIKCDYVGIIALQNVASHLLVNMKRAKFLCLYASPLPGSSDILVLIYKTTQYHAQQDSNLQVPASRM
jgi:hypothetical protein